MKSEKEDKEKILHENLQNEIFVNYNLLLNLQNINLKLEEIKNLLTITYELNKENKEGREGVFR